MGVSVTMNSSDAPSTCYQFEIWVFLKNNLAAVIKKMDGCSTSFYRKDIFSHGILLPEGLEEGDLSSGLAAEESGSGKNVSDKMGRTSARSLTLVKHGGIVVDVGERDVDRGGAGQTPHLPPHVLGLDDHGVVFSGLPVHVCQRHPEHACGQVR